MTARVRRLDRVVVLLVGLGLVAAGLSGLDWRYGWLLDRPTAVDTDPLGEVVAAGWWPWAAAAGGVVLGLLGLWWLLAHLRRPGPSSVRLRGSDAAGLLDADLRSVASACADGLAADAAVLGVRGTTVTVGSRTVVQLTGRIDPYADPAGVTDAVARCTADLAAAFPGHDLTCRVVLDAPRRSRTGRRTRVRVR